VNFNIGAWVVDALKVIESSKHLKVISYGLVLTLLIYAVAEILAVIRWW